MTLKPQPQEDRSLLNSIARAVQGISLAPKDAEIDLGDDETPKWQHIAIEGQYLGYKNGAAPFELSRKTFEEMVSNFRSDPLFSADQNGVGMSPVIPWDFEHASEMHPANGSIPSEGTPAQGWIYDLQVRNSADGKAQLWALSKFLEKAREYIKNEQYKWSSIAASLDAVDGLSGKHVGAKLTSVALTNNPFIRGLQKVAATALSANSWFGPASSPQEAMSSIKELLGLKELASYQEVLLEVEKLKQIVETGNAPLGVSLDKIFSSLRTILNMEAMAGVSAVLDAISEIGQRAIEGDVMGQGGKLVAPTPIPASNVATSASAKGDEMNLKDLANKLGVREIESEVNAAIDDLLEISRDAAKTIGCSTKKSEILGSVIGIVESNKGHDALLSALGTKESAEAVKRIGDLQNASKELEEMKPKMVELTDRITKIDNEKAEADVDMVIAANKYDANIKDALLLQRKSDPKAFAEKFPVDPAKIGLTQNLTSEISPTPAPNAVVPTSAGTIDLSIYPGANPTAQVQAYLSSKNPDFKNYTHDERALAANKFMKANNIN